MNLENSRRETEQARIHQTAGTNARQKPCLHEASTVQAPSGDHASRKETPCKHQAEPMPTAALQRADRTRTPRQPHNASVPRRPPFLQTAGNASHDRTFHTHHSPPDPSPHRAINQAFPVKCDTVGLSATPFICCFPPLFPPKEAHALAGAGPDCRSENLTQ